MASRGGLRIGSKAEVVKTLRELLRVAHKRSPTGTRVKECQWTQQILSQVRPCRVAHVTNLLPHLSHTSLSLIVPHEPARDEP